jgi:hypothetical protein
MSTSSENTRISDHPDSSTGRTLFSDSHAAESAGVSRTRTEGISRTHSIGISHSESSPGSHPSSDAEDSGPGLFQLLDGVLTAVKQATGSELCTINPRVPLTLADDYLDGPDSRVQLMLGVQIPASCISGILRDHQQRIERRTGIQARQSRHSEQGESMTYGHSPGRSAPCGATSTVAVSRTGGISEGRAVSHSQGHTDTDSYGFSRGCGRSRS